MWFAILWPPERITGYYADEMGTVHFWVVGLLDTLYNWHLHYRLWWVLFGFCIFLFMFLVSAIWESPWFHVLGKTGWMTKGGWEGGWEGGWGWRRARVAEASRAHPPASQRTKRGRRPSWRGCTSKLGTDRASGRPRLVVGHSCLVKRSVHRVQVLVVRGCWSKLGAGWSLLPLVLCWGEEVKPNKHFKYCSKCSPPEEYCWIYRTLMKGCLQY